MSPFATRLFLLMVMTLAGGALAPSAQAVQIDPGGQGQVLLYPYYTVHNGQQTLLSIINTSDADQVLQVTLREALNGRSALQFKLWLGRWDSWTGTLFALADDGIASDGAGLLTRDRSCTTPTFFSMAPLTQGGVPYFPLSNENFSAAMSDGGPGDVGRARHGWIEVIALANVTGAPAASMMITGVSQMPANCGLLQNVALDPSNSSRPTGGLIGAASVIRVGAGTILSSRAEALSGFTDISLYSNDAMQPLPSLASVNEGIIGGPVSARIVDELGRRQMLTYGMPGSDSRPIDAVSAALMATRVKNEYQTSTSLAAATDWVVTLPTKPFYTDPALVGATNAALLPFEDSFAAPGVSKVCAPYRVYNQDQRIQVSTSLDCVLSVAGPFPGQILPGPFVSLYQAANAIPFDSSSGVVPSQSGVLAAPRPPPLGTFPDLRWHVLTLVGSAGWMDLNLATSQRNHRLPASAEGKVLWGLPAMGFAASNIVNNSVSNGVLANYASAVPHVTTVSCSNASDQSPCD